MAKKKPPSATAATTASSKKKPKKPKKPTAAPPPFIMISVARRVGDDGDGDDRVPMPDELFAQRLLYGTGGVGDPRPNQTPLHVNQRSEHPPDWDLDLSHVEQFGNGAYRGEDLPRRGRHDVRRRVVQRSDALHAHLTRTAPRRCRAPRGRCSVQSSVGGESPPRACPADWKSAPRCGHFLTSNSASITSSGPCLPPRRRRRRPPAAAACAAALDVLRQALRRHLQVARPPA